MKHILLKSDIKRYVQFVFFLFFWIGITIFVKVPSANKIYKLLLILVTVAGALYVFYRKRMPALYPVISLFVFASICLFSSLWSKEIQIKTIIAVFMVTFACTAVYFLANTWEKLDLILFAVILAVLLEFLFIAFRLGFSSIVSERMELEGFNSNQVGTEIVHASLICLYFFEKTRSRIFLFLYAAFMAGCFLTGSRAALIIFLAGGFLFYFHLGDGKRKVVKRIFLALFLLAAVLFLVIQVDSLYKIIGKRIVEGTLAPAFKLFVGEGGQLDIPKNSSNYLRWNLIRYGGEYFAGKPILGYGIDNYRVLIAESALGYISYAHNNYIELLADVGIIGFTAYYFPFLISGVQLYRLQKKASPAVRLAGGMWICLLLDQMVGVDYNSIFQRLIFISIFCILHNLYQPKQELVHREYQIQKNSDRK